jgi:glycosyltransferase involved in cell wall biosynthesis
MNEEYMSCQISVIMPVYNAEKYLKQAIESILNQTYQHFEFIIINDGSNDNSKNIINSFNDERIRIFNNDENIGIVETLNKGIKLSIGKYIARMDADDISLPDRLEKQIFFMEKNQEVGLCSGNVISIDKNGDIISKEWWRENTMPIEWLLIWENPIAHPTTMIRKKTLIENDLYYDKKSLHSEDYDLWCRIALCSKIIRLKDVLIYYRVLNTGIFKQNTITACTNSLVSNNQYIKNYFLLKCNLVHRFLTTFSQAIEETPFLNL